MKKIVSSAICIALVLAMSCISFAANFTIEDVSPKDGTNNLQVQNNAIKLYCSERMDSPNALSSNASKIKITDPDGNPVEFTLVAADEKYPNELWAMIQGTLTPKTQYTVEIDAALVSAAGNTLGKNVTYTFRTRNTSIDTAISMVMMLFFVGLMVVMTRKAAKQAAEADPKKAAPAETNPYKVAKQKGISVNDANKQMSDAKTSKGKSVEKKAQKNAQEQEEFDALVAKYEEQFRAEAIAAKKALNYKVKGPRSVRAAGGRIPSSVKKKNKAKRNKKK